VTTTPRPISTTTAPPPTAGYSQAVVAGTLIAVSGQTGRDRVTGELGDTLARQIDLAITNLEAILLAAGSDLRHVIKTTCFLADISHFREFDAIYRARFTEPLPARSTMGVALADGLLFEIEALAVIPSEA
jgi:2-iminobutanoate/2-iminopropanoate deaminase